MLSNWSDHRQGKDAAALRSFFHLTEDSAQCYKLTAPRLNLTM
jgi:hypothetical protein